MGASTHTGGSISPAAAVLSVYFPRSECSLVLLTVTITRLPSFPSSGVSGSYLKAASPFPHSALVVRAGHNVSLSCNLMSCVDITWYILHSDQLLPLLSVTLSKVGRDTADFYTTDASRMESTGSLEGGDISLKILEVEEVDAGLYFCSGHCAGAVSVNEGVRLTVEGERLFSHVSVSLINSSSVDQDSWLHIRGSDTCSCRNISVCSCQTADI